MEIVPHGTSNPGFQPATFQSHVQRSTDWATGAPPKQTSLFLFRDREAYSDTDFKVAYHIYVIYGYMNGRKGQNYCICSVNIYTLQRSSMV